MTAELLAHPALVQGAERASDADRAWFAANPSRSYRLRRPIASQEMGCPYVVVRQVRRGVRIRLPVSTAELGPPPDDEKIARSVWKLVERFSNCRHVHKQLIHLLGRRY